MRLSTAYAYSFSVILQKTRLITVRSPALVLHIVTKKMAAHLRHYLCAVLPEIKNTDFYYRRNNYV